MVGNSSSDGHLSDDFVIDLVQALDASTFEQNQHHLGDYLDVEALERLIESCDDVTVHITVENTKIAVSQGDVQVLQSG